MNMINVEEKAALQADINCIADQIRLLEDSLTNKRRELWWLQRPHIADFANEWYREGDDEGGTNEIWTPCHVDLNKQWLSIVGNQSLIDRQLFFIASGYGSYYSVEKHYKYLLCGLGKYIDCDFCYDPYPDFKHAPDTVRNPNYHE